MANMKSDNKYVHDDPPFRCTYLTALRIAEYRSGLNDQELPTRTTPIQTLHEYELYRPKDTYKATGLLVQYEFLEFIQMAALSKKHYVHINPVLRMLTWIICFNDYKLHPK